MKAVGEVMSIGKTYKEAFQKAIRSLETGRYGLGYAKNLSLIHIWVKSMECVEMELGEPDASGRNWTCWTVGNLYLFQPDTSTDDHFLC